MPLIEVARAATKDEAMAGLERWKAKHPSVWPRLEPADVLVDAMRGRSSAWYRIRLNLRHVPEADRPPQGPLEIDYNPWAGFRTSALADVYPIEGALDGLAPAGVAVCPLLVRPGR